MIAFFPLRTMRIDRAQGIFSRQLPRLLRETLSTGAIEVVEWTAPNGESVAHVLIESAIPDDVIAEECAARGCGQALLGEVKVRRNEVELSLSRWHDGVRTPVVNLTTPTLVEALQTASNAVATSLGVAAQLEAIPPNDAAVRAWCFDRDNDVLFEAGGVGALLQPDDAFRHAVEVVRAAPSWQPGRQLAEKRRDGWAKRGLQVLADALSEALSDALARPSSDAKSASVAESGRVDDALPAPLSTPGS